MKVKMRDLRQALNREFKSYKLRVLKEVIDLELDKEQSSVDEQIDAYLVKLEQQSAAKGDQTVENILARKSLRFLLEADEEAPAAPPQGQDKDKKPDPKVQVTRKLSVSPATFASHVARLIENYDSLLDVKRIILVRALKYAKSNHSESMASEMADILREKFQIDLADQADKDDDITLDPPVAVGGNAKLA